MKLLIMGPPGVGKGTQASRIKSKLNIVHLSTGDILRTEIEKKTNIGVQAKLYMDAGKLVPDQVLLDIIQDSIKNPDCDAGYLLDGFPRTLPQAVGLEKIMESTKHTLDMVISLTADENELVERLIKRGEESGRSDDTPEVIRDRQKIYWEQTAPLVDFYKNKGILKNVDGLGEISEITERILTVLK
jgi:adenylate kinase